MVDGSVLGLIRRVVLEEAGRLGIGVERIILFGSRARGDYREGSDYDILNVVRRGVDWRARNLWGSLEYAAEQEGIAV